MLDIVIVNWNAGEHLSACLGSLKAYGADEVSSVVVVDNRSSDGSADAAERSAGATVIRATSNLGFARACNLGARHANCEYLLFLNPDAAVYAGTLRRALDFMEDSANSNVGVCGVQLLNEAGQVACSCARFPSLAKFIAIAVGLDRVFPRLGLFMAEWDHAVTREVDQVIGAFFLVRRTVFEALGGFDEQFFVYFEEVDFSLRAKKAGWRSMFLADAQAFHSGGGSSNQVKARRLFYSLRSRLLYSFKHFSILQAVCVLLVSLLIEPLSRCAVAVGKRSWTGFKETLAAYGMLWHWLTRWIVRRERCE